jgi:hypothetical protein
MMYLAAAVVSIVAIQSIAIWRMSSRLKALTRLEARLTTFAHSLTLLTDTTETCFQALAAQVAQEDPRAAASVPGRAMRQRRVVGAARRGRTVDEIAANEELAESEVRLRLHLADSQLPTEGARYGAMR